MFCAWFTSIRYVRLNRRRPSIYISTSSHTFGYRNDGVYVVCVSKPEIRVGFWCVILSLVCVKHKFGDHAVYIC